MYMYFNACAHKYINTYAYIHAQPLKPDVRETSIMWPKGTIYYHESQERSKYVSEKILWVLYKHDKFQRLKKHISLGNNEKKNARIVYDTVLLKTLLEIKSTKALEKKKRMKIRRKMCISLNKFQRNY